MSSLPNSKSSFLLAARNCSALALAGAMVLPMTPALAQNAAPAADAAVAAATPQVADQDAAATPTLEVSIPDGYKYDGVNPSLVTTEGGTIHVKGAGYTKEWRAQHGTVALYIAPANNVDQQERGEHSGAEYYGREAGTVRTAPGLQRCD